MMLLYCIVNEWTVLAEKGLFLMVSLWACAIVPIISTNVILISFFISFLFFRFSHEKYNALT